MVTQDELTKQKARIEVSKERFLKRIEKMDEAKEVFRKGKDNFKLTPESFLLWSLDLGQWIDSVDELFGELADLLEGYKNYNETLESMIPKPYFEER